MSNSHRSLQHLPQLVVALFFLAGCAGYEHDHNEPVARQDTQDRINTAEQLNDAGCLSLSQGEYDQALLQLERALKLRENLFGEANTNTAVTLNNIAVLYSMLGDYSKAQVFARRASDIFQRIEVPEGRQVAGSLDNLANLYLLSGNYDQAEPLFVQALTLRERIDGPQSKEAAVVLDNLGCLYRAEGKFSQALPLLQRALSIDEKEAAPIEDRTAAVLNDLGELYIATGDLAKAEPLLWRALAIAEQNLALPLLNRVQLTLRGLLAAQGHREQAIFLGKQAVNRLQWMRAHQQPMARELRASFVNIHADYYRGLAALLIDAGRLAESEQVLTMLKEKEYFDFVRGNADDGKTLSARVALNPQEEQAEQGYARIRDHAIELAKQFREMPIEDSPARNQLREKLTLIREDFDHTLDQLGRETPPASTYNRQYLADLQAMQGTLEELSNSNGATVVLVHFIITPARLYILLTTPEIQVAATNEIDSITLNNRIAEFRRALKEPTTDPLPLAKALYKIIFAPIADDLRQAKAKNLMVDLDGALRYIPLAALNDGNEYLAEVYRITLFTAACVDKLKDRPSVQWQAAALGLTQPVAGFQQLPWVKEELEGIVNIPGSRTGVLPGIIKLDGDFTPTELRRDVSGHDPVLHIASHFVFGPGNAEQSYLILGNGVRLTLRQMKNDPEMRFTHIQLLTLSACETGLSVQRNGDGTELEGFATLAERHGAKAILASLWPVADPSTCSFMQSFYSFRQGHPVKSKAEALQQAQLALLKGTHSVPPDALLADASRGFQRQGSSSAAVYHRNPNAPFAHPYYWAPFIIFGNWL